MKDWGLAQAKRWNDAKRFCRRNEGANGPNLRCWQLADKRQKGLDRIGTLYWAPGGRASRTLGTGQGVLGEVRAARWTNQGKRSRAGWPILGGAQVQVLHKVLCRLGLQSRDVVRDAVWLVLSWPMMSRRFDCAVLAPLVLGTFRKPATVQCQHMYSVPPQVTSWMGSHHTAPQSGCGAGACCTQASESPAVVAPSLAAWQACSWPSASRLGPVILFFSSCGLRTEPTKTRATVREARVRHLKFTSLSVALF